MQAISCDPKEVGPNLEEQVFRNGLMSLRKHLGSGDVLKFPTRPNGTAVLMRQSFFERLFSGKMELLDFQALDVSAAQVDVKNLNLQQLLFLRCEYIDFVASSPAIKAQAEFLNNVDTVLEKRMSERLAVGGGKAWSEASRASEVVRLVLLAYGVYAEVASGQTELWLLRHERLEALLHMPSCELRRVLPSETQLAWCHRNLSRASAGVPKAKKQLHWEVELCDKPGEFNAEIRKPSNADQRRARIGEAFSKRLSGEGPSLATSRLQEKLTEALAEVDRLKGELEAMKAQQAIYSQSSEWFTQQAEKAAGAQADMQEEVARLRKELEDRKEAAGNFEAAAAKFKAKDEEAEKASGSQTELQAELATMRKELEDCKNSWKEKSEEADNMRKATLLLQSQLSEARNEASKACEEAFTAKAELQDEMKAVIDALKVKTVEADEAAEARDAAKAALANMQEELELAKSELAAKRKMEVSAATDHEESQTPSVAIEHTFSQTAPKEATAEIDHAESQTPVIATENAGSQTAPKPSETVECQTTASTETDHAESQTLEVATEHVGSQTSPNLSETVECQTMAIPQANTETDHAESQTLVVETEHAGSQTAPKLSETVECQTMSVPHATAETDHAESQTPVIATEHAGSQTAPKLSETVECQTTATMEISQVAAETDHAESQTTVIATDNTGSQTTPKLEETVECQTSATTEVSQD